jgi:hypothetical protein
VLLLSTSVCLYCLIIECAVIAVAVNGMTRACSSEWLILLVCVCVCVCVCACSTCNSILFNARKASLSSKVNKSDPLHKS